MFVWLSKRSIKVGKIMEEKYTIYPLTITVTATPSLNKLHGNHWQMINWKKKYLKELKNYNIIYGLKSPKKIRLTYFRYGSREFDNDNFVGGCKPLTDALKTLKIIWDDCPKFVDIKYIQIGCKRKQEKTMIFISVAL